MSKKKKTNKVLLDRDVSWLSFNKRVNDEAKKKRHTLGDQVMFHGITFSNLNEFLMVRYPAAIQLESDQEVANLVDAISHHYKLFVERFHAFNKEVKLIRKLKDLNKDEKKWAASYFERSVYPTLLPVTVDKTRHANIHAGMYVLVVTSHGDEESIGYIEIPNKLNRFIPIPDTNGAIIAIEDLVQDNLKTIFHDRKVLWSCPFSILRSAEIYDLPDKHMDPYDFIRTILEQREESWIVQVEIGSGERKHIKTLRKMLALSANTIICSADRIRLSDLKSISSDIYLDEDKPKKNKIYSTFPTESIFDYIKRKDRLAFHPFESYQESFVRFLKAASTDPDVVSIRICLYRVSSRSEIIDALLKAADTGKLVTVLVELKARFDEKHNMQISNILRKGGIRIIYTKADIKTHAKVCLVTRMEKKGLRIYSHIGTGNYSESNSKLYTDYSYFSADRELGEELTQFFNILTSDQGDFKSHRVWYAPYNMKSEILDAIEGQSKRAKKGKKAEITVKCNALTDESVANKLIEAARDGVKLRLIVRSACIIQPQKNIEIYSIVGTYLEHSRVYIFGPRNSKDCTVLIGSADLMYRNLSRRNELLIKVEQEDLKKRILNHIDLYLHDTVNRRRILPNYKYEDVKPDKKEDPLDCQAEFRKEAKKLSIEG